MISLSFVQLPLSNFVSGFKSTPPSKATEHLCSPLHSTSDSPSPLSTQRPIPMVSTLIRPDSQAHDRPLFSKTPLIENTLLPSPYDRQVLLKLENVQSAGSFKIRGMSNFCNKAKRAGCTLFVSSSGGNAGMAVAYAGRQLNIPVIVVIPKSTPEFMQDRLKAEGATALIHGDIWNEADAYARQLCGENSNSYYVSPFDHPDIWDGHATMIYEIHSQIKDVSSSIPKPSAVVLSVGGGGLLIGACVGMEQVGWTDVPIIAAETQGADSFAAMARENKMVSIPTITSIAKSLGATRVSDQCLHWFNKRDILSYVVSDQQAVLACERFAVEQRALVEPACGAALAVVYDGLRNVPQEKLTQGPVVVIVCGGNIATPELLASWKNQLSL